MIGIITQDDVELHQVSLELIGSGVEPPSLKLIGSGVGYHPG
jgi:hypothetical protein